MNLLLFVSKGLCLILLFLFFGCDLTEMCGNEKIAEFVSPDKAMKAVVFQRNCGATTDFSTQISLLDRNIELGKEGANIFAADTNHSQAPSGNHGGPEVKVSWIDDNNLIIEHHPQARILLKEKELKGVKVTYRTE